jgi:hypothetical protein
MAGSPAQGPGLFIHADMVNGTDGPSVCLLQNRFVPGDRVAFRVRVWHAQTGDVATNATVTVRFADGTAVPLHYQPEPPPTDNRGPAQDIFWAGAWSVPLDARVGILRYTIEAVDGPLSGTFEPFNMEWSLLTIVPPGQAPVIPGAAKS